MVDDLEGMALSAKISVVTQTLASSKIAQNFFVWSMINFTSMWWQCLSESYWILRCIRTLFTVSSWYFSSKTTYFFFVHLENGLYAVLFRNSLDKRVSFKMFCLWAFGRRFSLVLWCRTTTIRCQRKRNQITKVMYYLFTAIYQRYSTSSKHIVSKWQDACISIHTDVLLFFTTMTSRLARNWTWSSVIRFIEMKSTLEIHRIFYKSIDESWKIVIFVLQKGMAHFRRVHFQPHRPN